MGEKRVSERGQKKVRWIAGPLLLCIKPFFFNLVRDRSCEIEFLKIVFEKFLFNSPRLLILTKLFDWASSGTWILGLITSWVVVLVYDPISFVVPKVFWQSTESCCSNFFKLMDAIFWHVLKYFIEVFIQYLLNVRVRTGDNITRYYSFNHYYSIAIIFIN